LLSKLLRFRTLWAYGFDSAARRALERLRLVRKKNILFPSTNSTFYKQVGEVNFEVSSQLEFFLKINGGLMV